jgi:hypothetical protein
MRNALCSRGGRLLELLRTANMNAQRMAMSVASWYLILSKGVSHVLLKRRGTRFIGRFWAAASFATAIRELEQAPGRDLFTALVREGVAADAHYREHCSGTLGEACTHSEFVTRALRNAIANATAAWNRASQSSPQWAAPHRSSGSSAPSGPSTTPSSASDKAARRPSTTWPARWARRSS